MAPHRITTLFLCAPALACGLQLFPPPLRASRASAEVGWHVPSAPKTIYIDSGIATTADADGLILIPPSGYDFAALFRDDIAQLTGDKWALKQVEQLPLDAGGIFLGSFTSNASGLAYENGTPTSEGYELVTSPTGAFVGGTGARGMWWGTRTLLQLLLVSENDTIPSGRILDAPAYATRGYMLDAGRKWYRPGFLKELCAYASFFKMSEFHYHLSDNYPLNRGRNESWGDVYSHFSLLPEEDKGLLPILHGRENETLSRREFEDVQRHCAARGVTLVPEIEAPGHCLYLTKWKPELALPKRDLLNLSHPEAIPTVKRVWEEFLPWFATREVHVGADEYDSALADDYIRFVNEMADFVNATAGKRIRIWGTYVPSENETIAKDVVVQHWQYGQSDPVQLAKDGYEVVNSQDWWAYMSIKNDHAPILPARYPQFFNESRVLGFADVEGWQWTPADFNPFNETMQLPHGDERNKGAVFAAWNDNGPDASTQLEAYYAMRRGFALVGARAWSGGRGPEVEGSEEEVAVDIDFFSPRAPGQNLDRVVDDISWARSAEDPDVVRLGRGSKGMNYTLTLSVTGPFTLSGPDDKLELRQDGTLIFEADGWEYPLRAVSEQDALVLDLGHPGRIWVNATTSTHEVVKVVAPVNVTIVTDVVHGSVVWVDGAFAGRFEVFVYGGRNTQFSWSQMAFVAPLDEVRGGLGKLEVEGVMRVPSGGNCSYALGM